MMNIGMMNRKFLVPLLTGILTVGLLAGCGANKTNETSAVNSGENQPTATAQAAEQVVNVYSARSYDVDALLYEKFTAESGIKVNLIDGKAEELIERLKREGESTQADLFLTVDGGVLNNAKQSGLLQPVTSETIDQNVPQELRDPDNEWIGLSTRARVIVYAKDRVKPEQLSTYEDLTNPAWKGKVLVRPSSSLYNQSLLSSFIELNGEVNAEEWSKGLVANLARTPEGNDRDQAKAIVAGVGDVAIMNTYYVGLLLNSDDPEEVKVGQNIGVFFPNQETTGAHVNISGAGVIKHSKNTENALKLIEFLTGVEAQTMVTNENYEFPVNAKTELPELLKTWGTFKAQQIDFNKLGVHNAKAIEIMNKTGWK
ncbi:iron(III) transport system substrate-binding protein [Paenibacillus sp. PastF-3]|uniref:Fe(3+) ABC transporter substrate-binding protein n=2 Tax=Paenibacillus TaxID=44249 RepID=UPI00211ADABE|nr:MULTISPECIES: Fe(3+) ABC transporter substrate-binding protein [unclassified Paenibacillus]MDH6373082.1 iron(III) transport system substrate-binding protein [Paenibacillus sp. PastF-3]